MADYDYWLKQGAQPLFTEVDTLRPEQRRLAGKILLIGGNKGAFFAVAAAMKEAERFGAGECRVVLPDVLRPVVPMAPQLYFAPAGASGGFGREALPLLFEQAQWADVVVLVGDLGKNGETSVVLAELLKEMDDEKTVFLARDGVDAVLADAQNWVLRAGETVLFATMPQLQNLLRALYYPKIITLSMPMNQLVETLHKLTLSYGITVATLHQQQLVVAEGGEVVSMALTDTAHTPLSLFNGDIVVRMALLKEWNPGANSLKSVATAWTLRP